MSRRYVLKALAAGLIYTATPFAFAQQAGKDYRMITPPQASGSGNQIEVIEFFSYACPHCRDFDPTLAAWRKSIAKDVVFRRVPVSFDRPQWAALGRLYITLDVMELTEKLDAAVFDAIHRDHVALEKDSVRDDWLGKHGVDVRKFNDIWKSFAVNSRARRDEAQVLSFNIDGVPALSVDGRFMISSDQGFPAMLRISDALIAQVRAEKGGRNTASAPAKKSESKKK